MRLQFFQDNHPVLFEILAITVTLFAGFGFYVCCFSLVDALRRLRKGR